MIDVVWTQKASSAPRPYCPHQPPHQPMLSSLELNSYLHLSLKISQESIYKQWWYILISPSSRLWQRHETPRSSQPSSQLAPSQMPWRTSFTTVRIITTDTTGRVHWSRMTLCRDIRTLTVQHPNIPKQHEGRDPGWRGDLKLTLKKTWTNVKWNSKPNYRAGNFEC